MFELLREAQPIVLAALTSLLSLVASGHVVLHKRDVRAAAAWVGLIWLVPVGGAVLYVLLGINRIHRRASALRALGLDIRPLPRDTRTDWRVVETEIEETPGHLEDLARVVGRVTLRPLVGGNRLRPLVNGDAAYPEMLAAIDAAERSVALSTYIFDHDHSGREFIDALSRAVRRGVDVRVLIDAVGARYSWPASTPRELHRRGVPVGLFMRTLLPWRMQFMNLRTHRKILVVDGFRGFTGGMNIRDGHVVERNPQHPVQDLHFAVDGPLVRQLMQVFAEDWAFTRREILQGEAWFPEIARAGSVVARGIADGPGEDFDKMRMTLLGAVASARSRIRVVTPYFLPDRDLISALNISSMRGVEVHIVLPEVNNQPLVAWAATAQYWQLLERGCRIFHVPAPFDHSKIVIVDDTWSLLGSANWDPRSLRLNFEFNVECYDGELARCLDGLVAEKVRRGREVTKAEVDGRSLPIRLRDGAARLLSPYL